MFLFHLKRILKIIGICTIIMTVAIILINALGLPEGVIRVVVTFVILLCFVVIRKFVTGDEATEKAYNKQKYKECEKDFKAQEKKIAKMMKADYIDKDRLVGEKGYLEICRWEIRRCKLPKGSVSDPYSIEISWIRQCLKNQKRKIELLTESPNTDECELKKENILFEHMKRELADCEEMQQIVKNYRKSLGVDK